MRVVVLGSHAATRRGLLFWLDTHRKLPGVPVSFTVEPIFYVYRVQLFWVGTGIKLPILCFGVRAVPPVGYFGREPG